MGGDMGDEVFVDFVGPSDAETHIPPPMYAVPAAALGILPPGTRVTVGVPGSHWLIEENIIIDGPEPSPAGEVYNLICLAEWGAVTLRPHEQYDVPEGQDRLLPWKAPVSSMWVYRFATARIEVDQLAPWHPHLWFDNVRSDLDTPPSPRRARPARELPSLTGRRLHAPGPDGIEVLMAVSEPHEQDGEILVRLVSLTDYSKAAYGTRQPRSGCCPCISCGPTELKGNQHARQPPPTARSKRPGDWRSPKNRDSHTDVTHLIVGGSFRYCWCGSGIGTPNRLSPGSSTSPPSRVIN